MIYELNLNKAVIKEKICPDSGNSVRRGRYDGARIKLGDREPKFTPYLLYGLVKIHL